MKILDESANAKAVRKFAKILACVIVLSVAAFGDIMYIQEMQKIFTHDASLMLFCYLGAFTSFMAIGYLLLGKSAVFGPGGQMLAAWIVFAAELIIIALNIILVFNSTHTGFLAMWAFLSPATPVFHMVGVALIYFLDPELIEHHRDKELQSKLRQADRDYEHAVALARVATKQKQLEYTVRELGAAVNSNDSQARISQHATRMNDDLLTEMSGRTVNEDDIYNSRNERRYGRR